MRPSIARILSLTGLRVADASIMIGEKAAEGAQARFFLKKAIVRSHESLAAASL